MNYFKAGAAIALVLTTAACASTANTEKTGNYGVSKDNPTSDPYLARVQAPMDPGRKVNEQNCSGQINFDGANLRCK